MATPAERLLAVGHRNAQLRLGQDLLRRMRNTWALLDPRRLDQTEEAWIDAALLQVHAANTASTNLAVRYLRQSRIAALGTPGPVERSVFSTEATGTSLRVTGPVAIKSAVARGLPVARAAQTAEGTSAASALRHALDGGRQAIRLTTLGDPDAQGWARMTSGRACDFCSMLAGRGAVYSEATADFQSHDGCSCTAAPVWT